LHLLLLGACSTDFVTKNLVRMRPVSRQQSGSSPYLIDVSVGEQKVHLASWRTYQRMGGIDRKGQQCPFGYHSEQSWLVFQWKYQQGARWWVSDQGNYLFS